MNFGEFLLWAFWVFLLFAFLLVLFQILGDLFRDDSVSGWVKAIWIVALIFLTPITALIYVIVRGKGMQERRMAELRQLQAAQEAYIRSVASPAAAPAGPGAADQIAKAQELLSAGAISQQEFDALKAKALA